MKTKIISKPDVSSVNACARRAAGFTLIEALVALLALSIGLLGIAGLQLTGLRSNLSSSYRSQATYLSYDIIDRMRANRSPAALALYDNTGYGAVPSVGGLPEQDLTEWKAALAATLPLGDGSVDVTDAARREVTITVRWDDARDPLNLLVFTMRSRL
jgi:type IV pilus assembly protein PilV